MARASTSPPLWAWGAWLVAGACATGVQAQGLEMSGHLRSAWMGRQAASSGPLAQANRLQPGLAPAEPSAGQLQAEWRASTRLGAVSLHTTVTLQAQHAEGDRGRGRAWVNEATASGSAGSWQWSAGKKVVSWDVGHGFRPNDVVQQEARRALAPATLEGRPLLMAEHFTADTAWSLVWVNPTQSQAATGVREPGLAARVYLRAGAVDWHGFARHGARTGASLGAAAAWVASDALELHASVRHYQRHDTLHNAAAAAAAGGALLAANPWQPAVGGAGQQWLVGGTWTTEDQFSLMAEAWHDGTAPGRATWRQWTARNLALGAQADSGAPVRAVAGNLAWQAAAFSASPSLHRQNLMLRLSWTHGAWQPALDVLYHPADHGRMLTASLTWQGDRVKLEGGLRVNGGPPSAVVRQLPVQRQGYAMATWAF